MEKLKASEQNKTRKLSKTQLEDQMFGNVALRDKDNTNCHKNCVC